MTPAKTTTRRRTKQPPRPTTNRRSRLRPWSVLPMKVVTKEHPRCRAVRSRSPDRDGPAVRHLLRIVTYEHMFILDGCAPSGSSPARQPSPQCGACRSSGPQPVHGLRAPLHVLLRPPLRAARGPPLRRRVRALDPREDERRRGPPPRARPPVLEARGGLSRFRNRSVPARRRAPGSRGHAFARRSRMDAVLDRHARAADRPGHRRPSGRVVARRRQRLSLGPDSSTTEWRTTEPGTAPPASRLEAVRRLAEAGIHVGVGIAPILPGLSDRPEQLEAVVREARARAASIWASVVHLRPGVREHFLEALGNDWPGEVARYEALFACGKCILAGLR